MFGCVATDMQLHIQSVFVSPRLCRWAITYTIYIHTSHKIVFIDIGGSPTHVCQIDQRAQAKELVVASQPRYEARKSSPSEFTKLISRTMPLVNAKVSRSSVLL